jgi:hypothetical protein
MNIFTQGEHMRYRKTIQSLLVLIPLIILISCGGSSSTSSTNPTNPSSEQGSVFTVGTDAPLPAVVSCTVTITGVTLNNGSTDVPVFSGSQDVDFARLSGLHQLLDLMSVPTGTYTSATVTMSGVQIGYLNTSVTPPTVTTIPGNLSSVTAMASFPESFTLNSGALVGLRMEFDLRKSLTVDSSTGQVTGAVTPTFHMQLLNAENSNVSIDDFPAGVVGVQNSTTFTAQGPHGRQWTVQANNNTIMDDPDEPISSYTTNTVVLVSGHLDPVTHDIDASELQVVSNDKFYLGGLLTYVNPAAPAAATTADLYVRDELPSIDGIAPGDITALTLNGSENYQVGHIDLPITQLIFNNSAMVAGQRLGIGGALNTSNGTSTLTVKRVILRRQGQAGTLTGSVVINHGNNGTFQLNDNWTAGVLMPQPLTVMTTDFTNFINVSGLSGLQGQNGMNVRVVGFILFDTATGQPVMVARSVEDLTAGS